MSNTLEQMRHQIAGAEQLESVVRTMKAQAASSITQYENAVLALGDYYRTVEQGLSACFRPGVLVLADKGADTDVDKGAGNVIALVFGSEQGLVGKFNDELARFAKNSLDTVPGTQTIWAMGKRITGNLLDEGFVIEKTFAVPASITLVTPLVGQVLSACIARFPRQDNVKILIFHNRPHPATLYEPASQQLLPLDYGWQQALAARPWPGNRLPELIGNSEQPLLGALVREHLFISLYRACTESLASENASRLAAMQRAEKNINSLLEDLKQASRTLRQNAIDEELFDVIASAKL